MLLDELKKMNNSGRAKFMAIHEDSEKVLLDIIDKLKPKTILELGSGMGYSGLIMIDRAKDASVVTVEIDKENYGKALQNYADNMCLDRILPVNADAEDVVNSLANYGAQKFDLIFLDCNKSSYKRMISNLITLLPSGGVLFADDVLMTGLVSQDRSLPVPHKHRSMVNNLREFIDYCNASDEFSSVQVIDKGNGILVAIKK